MASTTAPVTTPTTPAAEPTPTAGAAAPAAEGGFLSLKPGDKIPEVPKADAKAAPPVEPGQTSGKAPEGAQPAAGEFVISLPEGMTEDALDKGRFDSFRGVASELAKTKDITAAGAAKIVAWSLEHEGKLLAEAKAAAEAADAAKASEWDSLNIKWFQELVNDPEIGGQNLPQTIANNWSVLQRFDPKGEFKAAVVELGLGSHPQLVKFINRIALHNKEDSSAGVGKSGASTAPLTKAAKLAQFYDKSQLDKS